MQAANGSAVPQKLEFIFNRTIQQEERKQIYCISFLDESIFATGSANVLSVYKINEDFSVDLVQAIVDEDANEVFYTCGWSVADDFPLLVAGGFRGIIKVINVATHEMHRCFIGHGNAVNDIKIHPVDQNLLFSASKDESIRMWNLRTSVCIAIFCGHMGHRDEVLSIDIHPLGNCFVSGGMDTSIKIWDLENSMIQQLVKKSYSVDSSIFTTPFIQFPEYATELVHNNYIDFVAWYGNLILSNAVDNRVSLWAPDPSQYTGAVLPIKEFTIPHMRVWFVTLSVNVELDLFAAGNTQGKIYIFRLADIDSAREDSSRIAKDKSDRVINGNANPMVILSHPRCTHQIRAVAFSPDNNYLIASCDDGGIWIWNIRPLVKTPAAEVSSSSKKR